MDLILNLKSAEPSKLSQDTTIYEKPKRTEKEVLKTDKVLNQASNLKYP
jgi:hypothetical protein